MRLHFNFLSFKIDMYFPEHNLAVQIEELDHTDRDKNYGNEREKKIEGLGCEISSINPDAEDFNILAEIRRINDYIIESSKKYQKNQS